MGLPVYLGNANGISGTFDGATPITITYTGISATSFATTTCDLQPTKVEFKSEPQFEMIKDGNGKPTGYLKKYIKRTINLECVIRASTKAAAIAALEIPADLSAIVIANAIAAGNTAAGINGTWNYESGAQLSLSDDGEAKMTIEMFQYLDPTSGAVITGMFTALA